MHEIKYCINKYGTSCPMLGQCGGPRDIRQPCRVSHCATASALTTVTCNWPNYHYMIDENTKTPIMKCSNVKSSLWKILSGSKATYPRETRCSRRLLLFHYSPKQPCHWIQPMTSLLWKIILDVGRDPELCLVFNPWSPLLFLLSSSFATAAAFPPRWRSRVPYRIFALTQFSYIQTKMFDSSGTPAPDDKPAGQRPCSRQQGAEDSKLSQWRYIVQNFTPAYESQSKPLWYV